MRTTAAIFLAGIDYHEALFGVIRWSFVLHECVTWDAEWGTSRSLQGWGRDCKQHDWCNKEGNLMSRHEATYVGWGLGTEWAAGRI